MARFAFDRKNRRISPTHMVFMWFGFFVLLGTVLLWLPVSHRGPEVRLDFISALFTAVSAACVTGLSVVNIHDTFSGFGQLVLLLLMEMGGIGIMTIASFGFRLLGRRLSLAQRTAAADAIYQNDAASEFKRTFMRIFRLAILIQLAGAAVMAFSLVPVHWHNGERGFLIWSAVFHSVSAFCNSGFTLYRDNLMSLLDNIPFLVAILILVTLGGLGHMVLNELYQLPGYIRNHVKKPFWLSLHTRVVLAMTALLIVFGVLGIWALGTGDEGSTLWHAVFETVSGRTAGFSIVHQSRLSLPSVILLILLMFIGGSPGSCAGGVKTTSVAIWMARIRANLRNDRNVNLFGFSIAPELVSRARILMAVAMILNVLGVFVLSIAHPDENLETLIFEQISAFGTVGLSMDFTPRLNTLARLWIIVSMFVGRLGPLSIALLVLPSSKVSINRPIGRIMVG
ncbi:MAG: ATPase [Planctomycetota bacterium]|jgi:trk system potassium uptake protein TrkH|nr:ATPase [Planctomycetota bacterium]